MGNIESTSTGGNSVQGRDNRERQRSVSPIAQRQVSLNPMNMGNSGRLPTVTAVNKVNTSSITRYPSTNTSTISTSQSKVTSSLQTPLNVFNSVQKRKVIHKPKFRNINQILSLALNASTSIASRFYGKFAKNSHIVNILDPSLIYDDSQSKESEELSLGKLIFDEPLERLLSKEASYDSRSFLAVKKRDNEVDECKIALKENESAINDVRAYFLNNELKTELNSSTKANNAVSTQTNAKLSKDNMKEKLIKLKQEYDNKGVKPGSPPGERNQPQQFKRQSNDSDSRNSRNSGRQSPPNESNSNHSNNSEKKIMSKNTSATNSNKGLIATYTRPINAIAINKSPGRKIVANTGVTKEGNYQPNLVVKNHQSQRPKNNNDIYPNLRTHENIDGGSIRSFNSEASIHTLNSAAAAQARIDQNKQVIEKQEQPQIEVRSGAGRSPIRQTNKIQKNVSKTPTKVSGKTKIPTVKIDVSSFDDDIRRRASKSPNQNLRKSNKSYLSAITEKSGDSSTVSVGFKTQSNSRSVSKSQKNTPKLGPEQDPDFKEKFAIRNTQLFNRSPDRNEKSPSKELEDPNSNFYESYGTSISYGPSHDNSGAQNRTSYQDPKEMKKSNTEKTLSPVFAAADKGEKGNLYVKPMNAMKAIKAQSSYRSLYTKKNQTNPSEYLSTEPTKESHKLDIDTQSKTVAKPRFQITIDDNDEVKLAPIPTQPTPTPQTHTDQPNKSYRSNTIEQVLNKLRSEKRIPSIEVDQSKQNQNTVQSDNLKSTQVHSIVGSSMYDLKEEDIDKYLNEELKNSGGFDLLQQENIKASNNEGNTTGRDTPLFEKDEDLRFGSFGKQSYYIDKSKVSNSISSNNDNFNSNAKKSAENKQSKDYDRFLGDRFSFKQKFPVNNETNDPDPVDQAFKPQQQQIKYVKKKVTGGVTVGNSNPSGSFGTSKKLDEEGYLSNNRSSKASEGMNQHNQYNYQSQFRVQYQSQYPPTNLQSYDENALDNDFFDDELPKKNAAKNPILDSQIRKKSSSRGVKFDFQINDSFDDADGEDF